MEGPPCILVVLFTALDKIPDGSQAQNAAFMAFCSSIYLLY